MQAVLSPDTCLDPAQPPSPPPGTDADVTCHPLVFHGRGRDYARLWGANLALTLLTLGLYAPFARLRTLQYFFGHTEVAGSPVEFTARWQRMFKWFLLAASIFVAYHIASDVGRTIVFAGLWLLFPWVWGATVQFRLSHLRWRGVRLALRTDHQQIYRAHRVWLLMLPVGFAGGALFAAFAGDLPFAGVLATIAYVGVGALMLVKVRYEQTRLVFTCTRIGHLALSWKADFSEFLRPTLLVLLVTGCLIAVLLGVMGQLAAHEASPRGLALLAGLLVLSAVRLLVAWREARLFRAAWSKVRIGEVARTRCALAPSAYVRLSGRNLFLTVLTIGLYRPFAAIREHRMKIESVTLHVRGGVDQVQGTLVRQGGAPGDAVGDLMGIEFVL